jgi:hypothetical protein
VALQGAVDPREWRHVLDALAAIVRTSSAPDGKGYWEVVSDGGIFAFGDAGFTSASGGGYLMGPPMTGSLLSTMERYTGRWAGRLGRSDRGHRRESRRGRLLVESKNLLAKNHVPAFTDTQTHSISAPWTCWSAFYGK